MNLDQHVRTSIKAQARQFRHLGEAARGEPAPLPAETTERLASAWDDAAAALDLLLIGRLSPTALRARTLAQVSALARLWGLAGDVSERARIEARRRPFAELAAFLQTLPGR